MKKLFVLLLAVPCMVFSSCLHHSNVNIDYKDKNDVYTMNASFGKNKMHAVEAYMNESIGTANNMSFSNTVTDAVFTLADGSKFFMKKSPGEIYIQVKKVDCSDSTLHKLKSMCERLKEVIVR